MLVQGSNSHSMQSQSLRFQTERWFKLDVTGGGAFASMPTSEIFRQSVPLTRLPHAFGIPSQEWGLNGLSTACLWWRHAYELSVLFSPTNCFWYCKEEQFDTKNNRTKIL